LSETCGGHHAGTLQDVTKLAYVARPVVRHQALDPLTRLVPWRTAIHAVCEGADVYLFLAGIMLLSELAQREGVFGWPFPS
jgi:hypothetical protein